MQTGNAAVKTRFIFSFDFFTTKLKRTNNVNKMVFDVLD